MSTAQQECAAAVEFIRTGQYEDARGLLESAVSAFEESFGDEHQVTAVSRRELAKVYIQLEQFDQAEVVAQKAFEVLYEGGENQPGSGAISALARLICARAGLHKWAALESELELGTSLLKSGAAGEASRELKAAIVGAKKSKKSAEDSIMQVLDNIVEPAASPRVSHRSTTADHSLSSTKRSAGSSISSPSKSRSNASSKYSQGWSPKKALSTRRTSPIVGFGTEKRSSPMGPVDVPGPQYNSSAKDHEKSRLVRNPTFSIGSSERPPLLNSEKTPAPSAYGMRSGFGRQADWRPTSARCSIGSAPRTTPTCPTYTNSLHNTRKNMTAGAKIGSQPRFGSYGSEGVPGVGQYKIRSFIGKQALGVHRTSQAASFGVKHSECANADDGSPSPNVICSPGPAYRPRGGLGERFVDHKTNFAAYSMPHQPRFSGYGTANPGYGSSDSGPGPGSYSLIGS